MIKIILTKYKNMLLLRARDKGIFEYNNSSIPASQILGGFSSMGITGTVKWFSKEKGYGFLTRDDNQGDVFVHFSAIDPNRQGFKTLVQGQRVEFEVDQDSKGPRAKNVRVLS